MPSPSARPCSTALVAGSASASTRKTFPLRFAVRRASISASAAEVASSRVEALETSIPVRSQTMVWKVSSASRRPCEISGWYGV